MTPERQSRFRYPLRALGLDYAGAIAGLACSLGPLGFVELAGPVVAVLSAVAVLFLVYFGRTFCRQLTRIELDEAGIRVRGPAVGLLSAAIRWENLRSLRLDYYSTRRDREGGWMQLKLRDAGCTIRIDSELDGFAEVVGRAARAAAQRRLALDSSTASNLQMLGS